MVKNYPTETKTSAGFTSIWGGRKCQKFGVQCTTNTWSGHIYEFDRLLKNEERKEIEKYLGQKYRIAVS